MWKLNPILLSRFLYDGMLFLRYPLDKFCDIHKLELCDYFIKKAHIKLYIYSNRYRNFSSYDKNLISDG